MSDLHVQLVKRLAALIETNIHVTLKTIYPNLKDDDIQQEVYKLFHRYLEDSQIDKDQFLEGLHDL